MRFFSAAIFAIAMPVAASGAAHAHDGILSDCLGSATTVYRGDDVSINWGHKRSRQIVVLGPHVIRIGAGVTYISPARAQIYAPLLADLRAAVVANRSVVVYFDPATKIVSTIVALWESPC